MDNKQTIELKKGCLIVFEGIDGTGKSTQLNLLAKTLTAKGYDVIATREPTEGVYGKRIRELYINRDEVSKEEELDLFIMDRQEHVTKMLNPELAKRKIILCDRYYLSTIAYQGAEGVEIDMIMERNSFAPEPDIALLFQLPLEVSIARITENRGDSLNDFEQYDSLLRVGKIFSSLTYPYIQEIDANRSIEDIHQTVVDLVESYLDDLKIIS